MIGPATKCICDHRYKDHNYTNAPDKKVACKVKGCPCSCFYYVPVHGSSDFKCLCKTSYRVHDPVTKKCPSVPGKQKTTSGKFSSTWSCSCNSQFGDHITIIESREERIAAGKPVDDVNRMMGEFDAITNGGLVNFTSMVSGAERFENKINNQALGYEEKQAIGYDDQPINSNFNKKSIQQPDNNKRKISNENYDVEKKMSNMSIGKDSYSMGNNNQLIGYGSEKVTALQLYTTPHNFKKTTTSTKKPIKY